MHQSLDPEVRPWQSAIRSMLGDPAFCFPIAAAQVQYRDRYYGMSAASLLEDLFFDSLVYYMRQNHPTLVPARPSRGEKGYDYEIAGEKISHKVGKRATQIAVLWDATRRIERWSAPFPLVYHSFDATGRQREIKTPKGTVRARSITSPTQRLPRKPALMVVHWRPDGTARRLGWFEIESEIDLRTAIQFRAVWGLLKAQHAVPANEIELLAVSSDNARKIGLDTAEEFTVSSETRPGIYFLDPDLLHDVALTRNNRAQLVPAKVVEESMAAALATARFVPLPTWFSMFAQDQPPSLYLAQKAQFDDLFKS